MQVLLRQGVRPERLWLWRRCWYTANDRCVKRNGRFCRAKAQNQNWYFLPNCCCLSNDSNMPELLLLDVAGTLPLPATFVSSVKCTNPSSPAYSSSRADENPLPGTSQDPHHHVSGKASIPVSTERETAQVPHSVTAKRGSVVGGTNPTCPRCSKNVYFAEMIQGPSGSKYHKLCFRCSDCDKSLDSMNSCVTTQNILLCKTCYSKKHGPAGFGCVASCRVGCVVKQIICRFRGAMATESQGK